MIFKNIKYVLNALLKDIKKIWFISTLVAEISFILLYAYSIYSNINNLFFLIIYSVLFVVSLSAFILHWILYKKYKQEENIIKKGKGYLSHVAKIAILVAQVVEMLKFGISDFNKILLIVSAITLVVGIIFEFVKMFAEKYISDFSYAIEQDITQWFPSRFGGTVLKYIDAPLEKLANKKTGEKQEKSEQEVRFEKYEKEFKEQKAIKKDEEKERVEKELGEIKSHVKEIFSKTDKKVKKVK